MLFCDKIAAVYLSRICRGGTGHITLTAHLETEAAGSTPSLLNTQ